MPQPAPIVDLQVSNWYTSTYPRSPFVTGLIVCAHRADGSRLILDNWDRLVLTEQTPTGMEVTPVTREQVPGLLAERFGLPGFELGADQRLTLADSAPTSA